MAELFSGKEAVKKFRTERGYSSAERGEGKLSPAAEDYLEMIFRLSGGAEGGCEPVRIGELAEALSVSPSSASRMAGEMSAEGYVDFKRYGYITLTQKGSDAGKYLIYRHDAVRKFLEGLVGRDCLVECERIEHYLPRDIVDALSDIEL